MKKQVAWWGIVAACLLVIVAVAVSGCSYADDASVTVFNETKASTLLVKYEWFKDMSASLDKANANLKMLQGKIDRMEEAYKGVQRNQWARVDAERQSQWLTELDDQKAVYNNGASQYNSQMSKINWAFTNRGGLPQGATEVLPREFKPYIEQ